MKEGDPVDVKVLSVDRDGKIRLTRRELLPFPEGPEGEAAKKRLAQAREQGAGPPAHVGLVRRVHPESRNRKYEFLRRGFTDSRRVCTLCNQEETPTPHGESPV